MRQESIMARRIEKDESGTGKIKLAPLSHSAYDWNSPFKTKAYMEFESKYSTDYIICSNNLSTTAGFLTMKQTEDFFLLLSGE
jgi:hypothetical protein